MKRIFPGSHMAVNEATKAVITLIRPVISTLSEYNTICTPEMLDEIETTNQQVQSLIGTDWKGELKEANLSIQDVGPKVVEKISDLKMLMDVSYRNDINQKNYIQSILNIKGKLPSSKKEIWDVTNSIAESLPQFKDELVQKGVNTKQIDDLIELAQQYISSIASQTVNKSKSVKLTSDQTDSLNKMYLDVVGLCKVAKVAFKNDPEKQKLFNYTAIIRSFSRPRTKKSDGTTDIPVVGLN